MSGPIQAARWLNRANAADAQLMQVAAAADYLGNGAIEINKYETEIYDIIRPESVFLERVDRKPANGHPHHYFEQTAIATAAFTDPRNIVPSPTGASRVERAPTSRRSPTRRTCRCSTSM